jgi:N-acyl-D-aspartate/D-glutamate deacylase
LVLDLIIEGGLVVDGTGGPAIRRDVEIEGGRVTGLVTPGHGGMARRRINAEDLVVSPGFVDIHTHLDAQLFWDPYCTPTSLYGITSVVTGNCGFSIAPLREDDGGYLQRLLAEVEAIPVEALEEGVPWNWQTFDEYLQAVELTAPAVNIGVMAGHSALRRMALGTAHADPDPGPDTLRLLQALLRESMEAGAIGFSSSWNSIHNDGEGDPVPSRFAPARELVTMSSVLADFPGSQVEFIPTVGRFSDEHIELMIAMSLAARAPLNWNVLIPEDPDVVKQQLAVSDLAANRGARILALTYPGPTAIRVSNQSRLFRSVPGWAQVLDMPPTEAVGALRKSEIREKLRSAATAGDTVLARVIGDLVVADSHSAATSRFVDCSLGVIASGSSVDAYDVLFDLWVGDQLGTGFTPEPLANSEESWRVRLETWRDPRVIIGASDAGAHVQVLSTFDYPVVLLALARDLGAMDLPEAIHKLTAVPATLYGLKGRGRIVEGAHADIVVFDAASVGPGQTGWKDDLPGGAGRIYREPTGIAHVIVNGTEIVGPKGLTGARPGTLLKGPWTER